VGGLCWFIAVGGVVVVVAVVENGVCERKRRPTESRAERTSSPMICRAGAASEDVHSAMWSSIIAG